MSSTTKDVIGLQRHLQNLIDDVMDNFNFYKVRKVMKQLNWRWGTSENGIPEIYELKEAARRLLNECLYNMIMHGEDSCNIATGGFHAKATNYKGHEESEDSSIGLHLAFEVEDWDAY